MHANCETYTPLPRHSTAHAVPKRLAGILTILGAAKPLFEFPRDLQPSEPLHLAKVLVDPSRLSHDLTSVSPKPPKAS